MKRRQFHAVRPTSCSCGWRAWDADNKCNGISHNITRNHLKKLKGGKKEGKNNSAFRRTRKEGKGKKRTIKKKKKEDLKLLQLCYILQMGDFQSVSLTPYTSFYMLCSKTCTSATLLDTEVNTWQYRWFPRIFCVTGYNSVFSPSSPATNQASYHRTAGFTKHLACKNELYNICFSGILQIRNCGIRLLLLERILTE